MPNEIRFQPRHVLACVAEGTLSDHAVRAAAELATTFEARLDLVHAVTPHPTLGARFGTAEAAALTADAVARAKDVVGAHLSHAHHGVEVGGRSIEALLHVVAGNPAKAVLDRAAATECDLIVLGDSGRKKQLDFGGAARGILANAHCPVWIQTQWVRPVRRILVPVDLSEHSMAALATAVDLAKRVNAHVTVLHGFSAREFAYVGIPYGPAYESASSLEAVRAAAVGQFDEVMAEFDWGGVEHVARFVEEEPSHAILARQDDFDLITMGTHGRTGLAATLIGSVAYHVLRSSHTPVLAIRMAARPWLLS
jgi:nucleotide-binding universal stress UspA family protein